MTENQQPKKFGTFLGVFTPSVLTIMGVIMYLRFGWVISHAGLAGAIAIVLICNLISFITALGASAVSTNMRIEAGGEYYLVSRSLGVEIGGSIGIPLFMCRTLSITLYCFGLAEALAMFWPAAWGAAPVQWIAAALVLFTIVVAGKSADVSLKLQVPLLILVAFSIAALTAGVLFGPLKLPNWFETVTTQPGDKPGFWFVLAVFFPAVTGFTAGIGMSGDLKNPQKSIPRGTIIAVLIGLAAYLIIPILLGITAKVSINDLSNISTNAPPLWTKIALFGGLLVFPGMWSAILSSAFGSALGGPRVLQALARDGLMPRFLMRTSKTGQPTIATWVTGAIALAFVAVGELNSIAKLVTIFFLTLYVCINTVAAVETIVSDPSYRPTIRIPWFVSAFGVIGSLVVMCLISWWACIIAIFIEILIYLWLKKKKFETRWGDVRTGFWGSMARLALYKMQQHKPDPRSWRPNILLFANHVEHRNNLVKITSWLNQNHGVLTVCDLQSGNIKELVQTVKQREQIMVDFFEQQGISAFAECNIVENFYPSVMDIIQANGMGKLRSNTIAFGWPRRNERLVSMMSVIRDLHTLEKSAIIIKPDSISTNHVFSRIDVWWRGKQNNGDLMLLLAYIMKHNVKWSTAEITLRSIVSTESERLVMEQELANLIESVRIKASHHVILQEAGKTPIQIMHETSKHADAVLLGLMITQQGGEETYSKRLAKIVDGLPTTILVSNNGPFKGQLI